MKHIQRQQFSFVKTSIKVSKNPESLSIKLKFMLKAGFPVFAFFKDELKATYDNVEGTSLLPP